MGALGAIAVWGGSFANQGSTPPNGLSKTTTTGGQPSPTKAIAGPKCFQCSESWHRMVDCRKGEKYGKGLLVDFGGAFEEQGDGEEQEVAFDGDREVKEEFVKGDDGPLFMVRRVCFTPRKAEDGDE